MCVADGRGVPIPDTDDKIGFHRHLGGQAQTDVDAGAVHDRPTNVLSGRAGIRRRNPSGRVREPTGTHPVGVDGQQFAGLDVSNERRTDDVEGSGLEATTQPRSRRPSDSGRTQNGSRAA